jgi:hypothetical protein
MENVSAENWSLRRDWNMELASYEAGTLLVCPPSSLLRGQFMEHHYGQGICEASGVQVTSSE